MLDHSSHLSAVNTNVKSPFDISVVGIPCIKPVLLISIPSGKFWAVYVEIGLPLETDGYNWYENSFPNFHIQLIYP